MPRLRRGAAAVLVLACLLAAGLPLSGGRAGAQTPALPDDATFQLVTMTQDGAAYRSVMMGTAFFIDADGTALTNSHVVYMARQNPGRYRLIAIVGHEFYSATLVCAAALPYDPAKDEAVIGRDIAEVKLGPSQFPFTRLSYGSGGPQYDAHLTRLPPFPALTLGGDPSPGTAVRIIGYGHVAERYPATPGTRWTATGTVDRVGAASDATPVFRIVSTNRPREGNSGSPVLDPAGRVVGMWTWNEAGNLAYGDAIGSSALTLPCRL